MNMNILVFFIGVIVGVALRNIIRKIINVDKKIKWAEKIVREEQERLKFKYKHDIPIGDEESETESSDYSD